MSAGNQTKNTNVHEKVYCITEVYLVTICAFWKQACPEMYSMLAASCAAPW